MFIPAPSEGSFTPPPAGTHLAICYRVIDLGTQHTTYQGEAKTAHQVLVSWELPDELMDDGRPFTISRRFTWSMHEKAALRKFLEAWRGTAFKDTEFGPGGFDVKNIVGKPCTLNVVHDAKNGTTYANISGVGKVMKGVQVPPQVNHSVYLWLVRERWEQAIYAGLSANIQQTIAKSPQYQELMHALDNGRDAGDPGPTHNDLNDEIPF